MKKKFLALLISTLACCGFALGGIACSEETPVESVPGESSSESSSVEAPVVPEDAVITFEGDIALAESYVVGQRLIAPAATFLVDGKAYPTMISVQSPDGRLIDGAEYVLQKAGVHSLRYSCVINGKLYTESKTFNVKKETFAFDGKACAYEYDGEKNKIDLAMVPGDTFRYNVPVSLKGKTMNDELISTYVTSSQTGKRDFSEYYIVMTDVYDSSNQVYIRVKGERGFDEYKRGNTPQYAYCMTQSYVGVEFSDSGTWVAMDDSGKISRTELFGKSVLASFSNEYDKREIRDETNPNGWAPPSVGSAEEDWISLRYDAGSKSIYVQDNNGLAGTPKLVADLNDEDFFDGNWKGFTNDECYISLYVKDVSGSAANLTIKNIDGLGSHTGVIEDTTAPTVDVDFGDYTEESLPKGIVNEAYKIFDARALDLNVSNSKVDCKVYYNYRASTREMVPVVNGEITPKQAGVYTVIYEATDDFGNTAEKTIEIDVVESATKLSLTAENGTATAGVLESISEPTLLSADESLGKLYLKVTAKRGEIADVVYSGKLDEYVAPDYIYMLAGEWDIEYTVSDYSRTATHTAKVAVNGEKTVIFDDFGDLAIDKYLISENSYLLPVVNVVSFTETEAIYTPARIKAIYAGGEAEVENNLFTANAAVMGGEVELVYYDANDESVYVKGARTIYNIGSEGALDFSKMFLAQNATVKTTEENFVISATQNSKVELITKQYATAFAISFNPFADPAKGQKLGAVNVILTDSENANISVKIRLEDVTGDVAGNTKAYINEEKDKVSFLQESFTRANNYVFNLKYNDTVRNITLGIDQYERIITKTVDFCQNGDVFNGFPSQAVYVTIEMENITGEAIIDLYTVNNTQAFTTYPVDDTRPNIIVDGGYALEYNYGDTLTTATARGIDAITGYSTATISVREKGGAYLKSVDGKEMKDVDASVAYQIQLEKYAEYLISYNTKDRFGNKSAAKTYTFTVEDKKAPTLTITGGKQNIVSLGTAFVMPSVTVSDDYAQSLVPFAMILTPDHKYETVTDEGYVFDKKGSYKVVIGVFDGNGNMTTEEYYVEVI